MSTSTVPAPTPVEKEWHTKGPVSMKISDKVKVESTKLDVWSIFNPLNMPKDSLSLGQGFMNWAPPPFLRKAAQEAIETRVDTNHYSHPKGRPRLRQALSAHYSPEFTEAFAHLGRTGDQAKLNPETEILVTAGANEGIYSVLTAFVDPGSEVIMFEPFFDQYYPSITFNGGTPVYVPLHPARSGKIDASEWKLNIKELRAAITDKTKVIILNTPHNPIGKVFDRSELEEIAEVAKEFNLLIISDEVYDCLTFPGSEHIRIANLPDMWHRTVTVGSAGKSFACTGWRVGWVIGPEALVHPTLAATTRIVFCTNSPLQEAAAVGFELAASHNYFELQRKEYDERRLVLQKALDDVGLSYTVPQGSYFIPVDCSRIQVPEGYEFPEVIKNRGWDFKVAWFVAHEVGIVSIPTSEFYCDEHRAEGEKWLRLAFCKDVETLRQAGERLKKLKPFLRD